MKEDMSYQEKENIISLISSVLILGFYSLYVYNKYLDGNPELINDFQFWGKTFLILIPVTIVVQIIIHIIFAIVNKIVNGEEAPTLTDERDKLIELKAIKISHWIFVIGFLQAMVSQAVGMQPWVMFISLIVSGFVASIAADVAKIRFYHKGL